MLAATGERQVAASLEGIRADHVERYRFAQRLVPARALVLDAACGVGYGTRILADVAEQALGVDVCAEAIAYARAHYAHERAVFRVHDVRELEALGLSDLDAVVSFETIEHLDAHGAFLAGVHRALRPGGLFVVSTPNEEVMPFDPARYPFHFRHFTPSELERELAEAGFGLREMCSQSSRRRPSLTNGARGRYLIAVTERLA